MSGTLIITTYNWPNALACVLRCVAKQTLLPAEVIVADDGSTAETRHMLEAAAQWLPCPLKHMWQPDDGFRVARSRNRAIAAAGGDWVVLLDGDMLLHPQFMADHQACLRLKTFVQGGRVLMNADLSQTLLEQPGQLPHWRANGIKRRRNGIRSPSVSKLYLTLDGWLGRTAPRAIKTCNQSWWRADLLALNGFDERMQGWGREDEELAWRAHHMGLDCLQLRYRALAWHLHHQGRSGDGLSQNDRLLQESKAEKRTRSPLGVDQHLDEFAKQPLPAL